METELKSEMKCAVWTPAGAACSEAQLLCQANTESNYFLGKDKEKDVTCF